MIIVVESKTIESVREFAKLSRIYQWNTVRISATCTPQEALASLEGIDPIF